ncbi:DinB family protein [Pseudochryseolinea flava]|uniref:Damage-inducible protein DinB n=1 Tax=Pseudochryseolinea flava TaxID=2059302 RepID=A0A364XY16_9BACT|nr:DinB family protein [Pseudochryseolinea flava]RAV98692.1 damage-inducible protein DinB [Pseudochryseolinea flava]
MKSASIVITPAQLLEHWLGHRRVTRRAIEAFPEDKLFSYSVGGMRPFAELVFEMLGMGVPGMQGVVTRKWNNYEPASDALNTKENLLKAWDRATEEITKLWSQIPADRFQEEDLAFGQWGGPIHWIVFYWIDNEIHHRAQGYVYLRSLGIEPPAFYDRS